MVRCGVTDLDGDRRLVGQTAEEDGARTELWVLYAGGWRRLNATLLVDQYTVNLSIGCQHRGQCWANTVWPRQKWESPCGYISTESLCGHARSENYRVATSALNHCVATPEVRITLWLHQHWITVWPRQKWELPCRYISTESLCGHASTESLSGYFNLYSMHYVLHFER